MNPRVRDVLGSTASWPRMRRAAACLTDADLAEAEALERLGPRRENILRLLKAERQRRRGRPAKMLHLKVEATR